jgi:hypothetical protein
MAGNPRDHVKGKGFWDGGGGAQGGNGQSAGRTSGFPGRRTPKHVGLRTDIEFPDSQSSEDESTKPTTGKS